MPIQKTRNKQRFAKYLHGKPWLLFMQVLLFGTLEPPCYEQTWARGLKISGVNSIIYVNNQSISRCGNNKQLPAVHECMNKPNQYHAELGWAIPVIPTKIASSQIFEIICSSTQRATHHISACFTQNELLKRESKRLPKIEARIFYNLNLEETH